MNNCGEIVPIAALVSSLFEGDIQRFTWAKSAEATRSMKRLILILCGVAVMGFATANAKTGPLQGEHLRKTISGKTVHLQTGMGIEVPISYSHNGTMAAKTQAMTAWNVESGIRRRKCWP